MRDQVQSQLNQLYDDLCHRNSVRTKFPTEDRCETVINELDGPFLINVSDEYLASSPKVLIVGQENNGWIGVFGKFLTSKEPLNDALALYSSFKLEETYNRTFFQYFARIRDSIHSKKSAGKSAVIWSNLFKFNQGMNPQMNYSEFREDALRLQGDLFQREVEILKPEVIIFLTGPYYDSVIRQLYPDVQFHSIGEHPVGQLALVSHERLPPKSFRTYHPSYLNRSLGRTAYCLPTILNNIGNKLGDKWSTANAITKSGGSRKHIIDLVAIDPVTRLNKLIGLENVQLADDPQIVPRGIVDPTELDLDNYINRHCSGIWKDAEQELNRGKWWAPIGGGNRPQMDLICRIKIGGNEGLLFVEAKAHEFELDWGGKRLEDDSTEDSQVNHENIMNQIASANAGLNVVCKARFNLTGTSHYQLANRLTYLWKLANCGVPCVLMYLGLLGDERFKSDFIRDDSHWQRVLGGYLQGAAPQSFPEKWHEAQNKTPFRMIVRSALIKDTSK